MSACKARPLAFFVQKNFMATKRQIDANRRNAAKSTGPRTSQGKASMRMNALQHGLRAGTVVLPCESQDDFDRLLAGLNEVYELQTLPEQLLVEQMAVSNWKLVRTQCIETSLFLKGPLSVAQIAFFDRLIQIQARLERASFKAYQELERLKRARNAQDAQQASRDIQEAAEVDSGPKHTTLFWVNTETGERTIVAEPPYPASHTERPTGDRSLL
jgi:hypothetical protein